MLNYFAGLTISQTVSSVTLLDMCNIPKQQACLLGDPRYPRVILHLDNNGVRIRYPVGGKTSIGDSGWQHSLRLKINYCALLHQRENKNRYTVHTGTNKTNYLVNTLFYFQYVINTA